jgi:ribosomal protein S18 acetylase RimI-like enzyme
MAATKRGAARPGKPAAPSKPTGKPKGKASPKSTTKSTTKATTKATTLARRKPAAEAPVIEVRRIHRRDLNRVWEFLKLSFAHVNLQTVEYQRPRSRKMFDKTYDEEGIDQLVFEVGDQIVAYAECAHEVVGSDNWMNEGYFERRNMRPLFVEELAVHPDWNGRGVGGFVLEQLHHLAKVRGLSHLVLEVAENNEHALSWYRKRNFRKLDSAIFLAASVDNEPELLPPKPIHSVPPPSAIPHPQAQPDPEPSGDE